MKKLLTIAMITLAAVAAKADLYLYWTVDLAQTTDIEFAAAGLMASGSSEPLYSIADGLGSYRYVGGGDWVTQIASSGSYLIALFDASLNMVGYSNTLTYDQLIATNHVIDYSSQDPSITTPWNGGSFTAVGVIPEPTSGLMLLLGLAGLALKRKLA